MATQIPFADGESRIPFGKLSQDELHLCVAIGERGAKLAQDLMRKKRNVEIEVNPYISAADVATAHLARPLKLREWLLSDDLSFMSDYISIQTNINRTCGTLPTFVHLRYAIA